MAARPRAAPRIIRFFRADDPFDASESFPLAQHPKWLLGRVDGGLPATGHRGRIWSCDDAIMSSRHALIAALGSGWEIADAGSKNGTFLNGTRLDQPAMLRDGDVIECGHSFFLYREQATTAPPLTSDTAGGGSLALPPLYYQIAPLYPYVSSDVSIHLQGETGTGKEIVAQAIHELSGRRGALVARNCAAIPENLFESELFGHVRGAFSGAVKNQRGQILAAQGGSLFLDEIGELSLSMQAKLLRVLEQKEVLPLGAQSAVPVDFRLISATLCDLKERVKDGRFRHDLYARLGRGFVIPPLREHKEELGRLIQVFLASRLTERVRRMESTPVVYFTLAASRALVAYSWPFNVRELRQCIESALIAALADGEARGICGIDLQHLPPALTARPQLPASAPARERPRALSDQELLTALQQADGNRAQAAKLLGLSDRTVFRRLRKLRELGHEG